MFRSRGLAAVALVASDAVLLVGLRPELVAAMRGVQEPRRWLTTAGTDHALATLAAAGLWCVAAWVGIGLVATLGVHLPGAAGEAAAAVATVALPAVFRRLVIGSAGLGVLVAPVLPALASATPPDVSGGRPAATAVPLPGPTWPGGGTATPHAESRPEGPRWPVSDRPADPAPTPDGAPTPHPTSTPAPRTTPTSTPPTPPPTSTPSNSTPAPAPTPSNSTPSVAKDAPRRSVPHPPAAQPAPRRDAPSTTTPSDTGTDTAVVRPGDCLWLLAAHRVGTSAADREVAAYLPRLYAANRDVIGDDPDLVRPGQMLHLPAPVTDHRESA